MTLEEVAERVRNLGLTREADAIRAHRCVSEKNVRILLANVKRHGDDNWRGAQVIAILEALLPAEPDPLDEALGMAEYLAGNYTEVPMWKLVELLRKAKAARKG